MKKWLWMGLFAVWSCQAEVTITDLVVAQRPGTKLVDITYDLLSTTPNAAPVSLIVKNGATVLMAQSLTGDLSDSGVSTGAGKSIVWNMGADWNGNIATGVVFTLNICPAGGDPTAVAWKVENTRWVKNTYANGDRTMSDRNTGRMWLYNAGFAGYMAWNSAVTYCNGLTYAGRSDWKLPDRDTLLAQYGQTGFFVTIAPNIVYWSSSVASSTDYAWYVALDRADNTYYFTKTSLCSVWPVRDGQSDGTASGVTTTANLDSRDYTLTVASAHGQTVPACGTAVYAWSASVTCSVASTIEQGINWKAAGWTGTGSVPASGTTNTTGIILLTNLSSSITWNWNTAFSITNLTVAQRSGTKLADITYDAISDLTNAVAVSLKIKNGTTNVLSTNSTGDVGTNVLPGTTRHIVWNMGTDWKTNSASLTYSVMHTTVTNLCASVVAPSDSRNYTLTVASAHGTPVPSIGTNLYAWQTTLTCSVDNAVSGRTNSTCSGWAGTGNVPASGDGNSTGAILLTDLNSSITWLWPVKTVSDLWASNVTATQRPGTKLVDISYGVLSTKTNSVKVSLAVLNGTNTVNAPTVSGNIGSGVVTGAVKSLVWNAGADWNGNVSNLTIRILGQDAQGAGATTPAGKVWIPAGQNTGTDPDFGAYSITVTNAFFMDASEITKAQWDTVRNWALTNGYTFSNIGSGASTNYPVNTVSWYDAAKWCNARSAMEGFIPCYNTGSWICNFAANGYRLPMSDEWQYAARGGLSGKRFPWGDTITHSNDIYYSDASYSYDISVTRGFHPVYGTGTAPGGTGTTNGYGLYAMSGNVSEWCQDTSGVNRALCGGSWDQYADQARCTAKSWAAPTTADYNIGFRTVQRASSSTSAEVPSGIPVDTRDYQLIVSSECGTPIPNIGTNLYAWRATVTSKVNSAVTSGLTNWTSAGWSGAGSVPVSGISTNTGGIILTGLVSSIKWNWNTNYWLTVATSGSGSVDPSSGWRPAGEPLLVTASPSNGWLLMGWSGDVFGGYNDLSIIIPMVRPVSVTATFSDDADGDGLLNTNETALGTNPRNSDSDGDGMNDPQELIAGTSPTNSASLLAAQLSTDGFANQVSWYGVSGRYYQLEYTDDLASGWTPKGSVISGANALRKYVDIIIGNKRFYRVRVSNSPSGF